MNTISRFVNCAEELVELTGKPVKPNVVVLGSYNSGKSTLINGLLGAEVSPVDIIPTTSTLLHFDYGESFKARCFCSGAEKIFQQREDLRCFLKQKRESCSRIDIFIPSPILKKCRLVDTPGIDYQGSGAAAAVEQAIILADKVFYLFHQRGIEDHNRLFLYKLASAWKNRNPDDISFWLNCNLGKCDGTSLEITRSVLREIFISQVKLNAVNTLKNEDIEVIKLFLEVELARDTFKNSAQFIKKIDIELAQRLKSIAGIKDECRFLSEFWGAQEISRKILQAGKVLHNLPSILKEMDNAIRLMNQNNLGKPAGETGRTYKPGLLGTKEITSALLDLTSNLRDSGKVKGLIEDSALAELYARIKENRFSIVLTGGFSTGKSTFLNTVLKDNILPTADGPSTSSVFTITDGPRKRALVHRPLQVVLNFIDILGEKAILRGEELSSLEGWLSKPDQDIAYLEAWSDGGFKYATKPQILKQVETVKELFAAGFFPKNTGRGKKAFKTIPAGRLKRPGLVQKVRVTFNYPEEQCFDLSVPMDAALFKEAVGPDHALRVDLVKIEHPSDLLTAYHFIDTPGTDWIRQHYSEQLFNHTRQKDAYLIFFNAKHILANMSQTGKWKLSEPLAEGSAWWDTRQKERNKFYFVINFADVISPAQQEAVRNFVRQNLTCSDKPGEYTIQGPRIFLISSLQGSAGQNRGITNLLKGLEEGIFKSRGREFFQTITNELYSLLDSASKKANDEIFSPGLSFERRRKLREAGDFLRKSKRRLKEIRNAIYILGR